MIKKTCSRAVISGLLTLMIGGGLRAIFAQAIQDTALIHSYPKLYQAVYQRDARQLLSFTSNSSPEIRAQAWRTLAQTPVDSLSSFLKKVKKDNSPAAWFALSMHSISAKQRRNLEKYWMNHSDDRSGVSLVLGRQGDAQSLSFLLKHVNEITQQGAENEAAMAISRLMLRFPLNQNEQTKIINAAFASGDSQAAQAWLYGFYRGAKSKLAPPLKATLSQNWQAFGVGHSAAVDQYVAKILGTKVFAEIIQYYDSTDALNDHVQLAIALARVIPELQFGPSNRQAVRVLLNHRNEHVKQQALVGLTGKLRHGDPLWSFIKNRLIAQDSTTDIVWLQALNTAAETDSSLIATHARRLDSIAKTQPYLYPNVLELWRKVDNSASFLNRVGLKIAKGDALESMYAVNALNQFWNEAEHKNQLKSRVRSLTFKALAKRDRGVTFSTQPLLGDSLLFYSRDFQRINRYLKRFSLPGDIEVYQTFGALYKKRFKKQAEPVIDSLAALGYMPLNRSLKQVGWEVEIPENSVPKFRQPDWNRLWKLGRHPVWVLQTNQGTIKVKMNTLSAPATVSAIDSLTRAGAYNGVPFHRVVPNFVIQGGDIERRDGFGGPDFTIPTEASERGFVRGAAGIASAGPDTEGSQYFFMLQPAPHLNGHYTLFGQVVEGMEVVDKIVVGDKVKRAYWEF